MTGAAASRAADEVARLRQLIDEANRAYYIADAPVISDAEYDRLFRELQALEASHPELASADSPTQRIGAEPASALVKRTHRRPMLSLANAFSDDELAQWEERNARLAPEVRTAGYVVEVKIDGTAVNLTYADGKLVMGCTRGNGMIGEDVTANLRTIGDVPLTLKGTHWPALMEIRGEVYLPYASFRRLNERREREGEPLFANPRNAAAGSLRQLDPRITHERRPRMFAFAIEPIEGRLGVTAHHQILERLEEWGFRVEPHHQRFASLADVQAAVATFEHELPGLPFPADGIVVKVDPVGLQAELGIVGGREPRWAIARKFAPEVAVTRLKQIRINVGRTGALNPWAELEPVELGGVIVSAATLHNEDLIAQKDIRSGDWVEVIRAGEVIPQVVGPLRERRDGSETVFVMPDRCPACDTPVERPADEAMRFCPNATCPGRVLEGIVHFASRDAMDIRGLGYERVRQLIDAGLIHDLADLYQLTAEQLVALDRFAEQSATQLVAAIATSRERPLAVLLFGLGIRHVGKTVAQLLARRFGSMDALKKASAEAIAETSGVGPTIADAVTSFFADPRNRDLVERLESAGLRPVAETAPTDGVLSGRCYVLTGTLPNLSRSDATRLLEEAGARVAGSVSKKTDAVVAGADAGGKLEKARQLGVEIIDEAELLRRVGRGS
ncbi:MAG TPA: NAD-dependent DNA ligase LigA [Gemmatimonadales bacterium]|nr:NAD-dependent DNA ligase LigA [Gemmatimonadales bacterium]